MDKTIRETREAYRRVCGEMSLLMDNFTEEHPQIQRPTEIKTYLSEADSFKKYHTNFELRIK